MPAISTIKMRRGTAAAWTSANPVLAAGEPGLETDTKVLKMGDGVTAWLSLSPVLSGTYDQIGAAAAAAAASVPIASKGAANGVSSLDSVGAVPAGQSRSKPPTFDVTDPVFGSFGGNITQNKAAVLAAVAAAAAHGVSGRTAGKVKFPAGVYDVGDLEVVLPQSVNGGVTLEAPADGTCLFFSVDRGTTPLNRPTTATTGGSLAPGTYGYRLGVIVGGVEMMASDRVVVVVPAGTSTNTVTLTWPAQAGATGYKVYGRTAGSELLIATLGAVLTYTDAGSVSPSGALPSGNAMAPYAIRSANPSGGCRNLISGLRIQGPSTRARANAVRPSNMHGIELSAGMKVRDVTAVSFIAGVVSVGDHSELRNYGGGGCYYALYFARQQTQGDTLVDNCDLSGTVMASIGVAYDAFVTGFTMVRGHIGFGPFGIYMEQGSTALPLGSVQFLGTSFEALGVGGIYSEGKVAQTSDVVLINCGDFSHAASGDFDLPAYSGFHPVFLGSMTRWNVTNTTFTTAGSIATINCPGITACRFLDMAGSLAVAQAASKPLFAGLVSGTVVEALPSWSGRLLPANAAIPKQRLVAIRPTARVELYGTNPTTVPTLGGVSMEAAAASGDLICVATAGENVLIDADEASISTFTQLVPSTSTPSKVVSKATGASFGKPLVGLSYAAGDATTVSASLFLAQGPTHLVGTTAGTVAAGNDSRFSSGGGGGAALTKRTGALVENFPRKGSTITTLSASTSGQLVMTAIELPLGATISSITFMSGGTALSGGTHAWAALYDNSASPVLLRQSTDDTSPVWGAAAEHTFTLSAPFVTTYAGTHYIGVMVVATTMPSLYGVQVAASQINSLAPVLCGSYNSGLTTTAPNPASLSANRTSDPWAWVA